MSAVNLGHEQRQHQSLSPRLQHAVRLLQLSSQDFAQEVQALLGVNPFLEDCEADPDEGGADEPPLPEVEPAPLDPGFDDLPELDIPQGDGSNEDTDRWAAEALSSRRRDDDSAAGSMDLHAQEESLAEHLLAQIRMLPLSSRDLTIAAAIIGSLDDDGYLRCPTAELARITGLVPPPSDAEMQIALSQVQSLEPSGVAARSVQECLALQLSGIDDDDMQALARAIVLEHFDLLAAKDLPGLAHALACPAADIQRVLECIRRLDPRPGSGYDARGTHYVTPDVVVRRVRGKWSASLNPAVVPKVRLNEAYVEMFLCNRTTQNPQLVSDLREARWTLNNVEQRFSTILGVARAILERQHAFLDYGPLAMKPLYLREIAEAVGIHESTVSRVINNKYMATPLGLFEFKHFFSRSIAIANGGECSTMAIRGLISNMISIERPHAPLSDAEIARMLARQGISLARRTVTKYRQSLRIEPFEQRRRA